jgi:hypothetical protein
MLSLAGGHGMFFSSALRKSRQKKGMFQLSPRILRSAARLFYDASC